MFDKLYFLGKGRELYFGPSIPHCLPFFEGAGYKCPEYENPADFLLDLVNTAEDKNAYASQAAIANEYRGLVFTCSDQEIADGLCVDPEGITGESILYNRGMEDVDIEFNIVMLWVLALAYRLVAFLCFWLFFRNQSPKQ